MKSKHVVFILLTSVYASAATAYECQSAQLEKAEAFATEAQNGSDSETKIINYRRALKFCSKFDWWMNLGEAQSGIGNWVEAIGAFEGARDFYVPDDRGELSAGKIQRMAVANLYLAETFWSAEDNANSLASLEESRIGFDILQKSYPEKLLLLQGRLDDSLADSDSNTLARSFTIQKDRRSRGVGIRPKLKRDEPVAATTSVAEAESEEAVVVAATTVTESPELQRIPVESASISASSESSNNEAPAPAASRVEARVNIQVLFKFNSADLTPVGRRRVEQMAGALSQLELNDSSEISVVGHSDSRGAADYNNQLSLVRAKAVVEYLKTQVSLSGTMQTMGRGESELRYPGSTSDDHRRNRRVEVIVRN